MSGWRDRLLDLRETIEERTGRTVESTERIRYLEESDSERRMIQRDLDMLAYTSLNYSQGRPQELKATERRRLAQRSRIVWMKDPQAGAACDLMNDFVFGRGMPKPKANDPEVQEVIDEAWEDPDNQLVLTSFEAQLALGTDLSLQSNLFFLLFEDGQDGKVKLGILDHDTVETVVRDPDNRLRILYYLARHFEMEWDYVSDQPKMVGDVKARATVADAPTKLAGDGRPPAFTMPGTGTVRYYEHWRNVEDAKQDSDDDVRDLPALCPKEKLGDGKVFHVAINRGTEMAFGHPIMDRLLRWFNSYNSFMDARVDIMAASAAFVMKRKVKGTPAQLERMATQALSRRSALGASPLAEPGFGAQMGPKAAGIITENDAVSHEDFNINTNAPAAAQDAQMIRSMISAGTRWPQSYYGDASQSNLATATSLELPVLKAVETRQEVFESIVRFFVDRVIERAVDCGRLDPQLTPKETKAKSGKKAKSKPDPQTAPTNLEPGDKTTSLQQGFEDQAQDEVSTERDLGYEFSMPSPLKRMIGDLVLAVMNIAKTFDPNNTNLELSRALLAVALGEGLELEDPGGAVERIYPTGYVDPAVAAAEGPPGETPGGPGDGSGAFGEFTPAAAPDTGQGGNGAMGGTGGDSNNGYGGGFGGGNPYGAVSGSQSPEQAMEARLDDESAEVQERVAQRAAEIDRLFEESLTEILAGAMNGNGTS